MFSSIMQKLPIIIAGLMLLIAIIIIFIRSKRVTKSDFFKTAKTVKLLTVWVLILNWK